MNPPVAPMDPADKNDFVAMPEMGGGNGNGENKQAADFVRQNFSRVALPALLSYSITNGNVIFFLPGEKRSWHRYGFPVRA